MKKEKIKIVDMSRIKLLWELDRWDVPITGILKLDGEKICFFKRAYHPADAEEGKVSYDDKEYKRYDIFELSNEQVGFETIMHEDFIKYVGSHVDFIDNDPNSSKKNLHLVKPQEEHKKFYEKYPNEDQTIYENNAYLGSFYM